MKRHLPHLKTAMTPFPYSIDVDAPLADARSMMDEHDFHHLPVTAGTHVVGMLDAAALARGLAASASGFVRDYHAPDARVVSIDEPLHDVLESMAAAHLDAVIVTRHGRLAGVFTTVDACRAFAALLAEIDPPADGGQAA